MPKIYTYIWGCMCSGLCKRLPDDKYLNMSELLTSGYGVLPRVNNSQTRTPNDH